MNWYRNIMFAMMLLSFVSVLMAQQDAAANNISCALYNLCKSAQTWLAIGMILMIILGAAVYAVGQMLGAETRARASVWGTAMVTGAVIAAILYVLVPYIISYILQGQQPSGSGCDAFLPTTGGTTCTS